MSPIASRAGPAGPHPSSLARCTHRAARLLARLSAHRVLLIAAGVTYYLLLALVPTLSVFVALYGLFNDPATAARHVDLLAGIVPSGGLDIVRAQLARLAAAPPAALSVTLVVSLLVALWSSSAGIRALFDAMNVAYETDESRSFLILNGLALLFTLGGILAALVAVAAVVVIPLLVRRLYLGGEADWLVTGLGYLVLLVVLWLGIGALYRWGPAQRRGGWRWISPGTLLGILATAAVSVLFSWYAASFGNYDATYGSLGALVGLLTWLWLTVTVLIAGAELNAEADARRLTPPRPPPAPVAGPAPGPRRPTGLAVALLLALPVVLLALAEQGRERRSSR